MNSLNKKRSQILIYTIKKTKTMRTKEEIKERIIELNFDLLRLFDNKQKVRDIRDEIQLLLIEYTS